MSTKRLVRAAAMVVGAALGVSMSLAAAANAERFVFSHSFGGFSSVWGIAVDNSSSVSDPSAGDVYVPDLNGSRIFKFNATGSEQLGELTFTPTPEQEAEGLKAIGLPLWVAVDPASGDVYASSVSGFVVTRFSATGVFVSQITESALPEEKEGHPVIRAGFAPGGIAVAPSGGELYVADRSNHVVDRFSAAGEYEMQFPDETVESGFASSITTGPAGEVYVTEQAGAVREFSPSGVPLVKAPCATNIVDSNAAQSIALDPSNGALFVEEESGAFDIARYSPPCSAATTTFGEGLFPEGSHGIAISTSHIIYATNREGENVEVFDPVGPPSAVTGAAKSITPTSAVLCGEVNPLSEVLSASYQFQYGLKESYGQLAPAAPVSIGTGEEAKEVCATVENLKPGDTYHFQVLASNSEGSAPGGDAHFATPPAKPVVLEEVHGAGAAPRSAATRNTR